MRFPLIPTAIVAVAVAAMVGLGVWQLQRAGWKDGLIEQYRAATRQPPVAWPAIPPERPEELYYRRAAGFCTEVTGWRTAAGRNRAGQTGWSHIASCRTGGLEGPGMQVEIGWSQSHEPVPGWRGGPVAGTIAPDRAHRIRLVADEAPPDLAPAALPDPSGVPNNHLFYAIQWFFFAIAGAVIYLLALRRRQSVAPPGDSA